ncbi:MAG: uncharacterized protein A8A55_3175 [Amphiamblys sp. WSBS2006]|nr:MAG: uncharacterized protein A8A55_3175 [Amphiamblys sp. WSBS2006]
MHEENVMSEFVLYADEAEHIAKILETKNKGTGVGKVKKMNIDNYAAGILPKLKLHKENVMEEFSLSADRAGHIAEILVMKDKSIFIGKVWRISFERYAKNIENKFDFTVITQDDQE